MWSFPFRTLTTSSLLSHLDGKNIFHGFKVSCELSGFGNEMKPLESLSLSSLIFCLCFVRFSHSPSCGQRSGSCKSAQGISFRQLLSISHSFFFFATERIKKSCWLLLCVLVLWLFRARPLTWKSTWKWVCNWQWPVCLAPCFFHFQIQQRESLNSSGAEELP